MDAVSYCNSAKHIWLTEKFTFLDEVWVALLFSNHVSSSELFFSLSGGAAQPNAALLYIF